jgi:thioredoxin-like negative regulator of GroEL
MIPAPASPPLLVACLCAAWCQLCNSYRDTFASAARRHPGHRFVFVDVEDEAELVGTLDVENFPTLLIAAGEQVRFFGVLTPQPETLARLLRAAEGGDLPAPQAPWSAPEAHALLSGLRALPALAS